MHANGNGQGITLKERTLMAASGNMMRKMLQADESMNCTKNKNTRGTPSVKLVLSQSVLIKQMFSAKLFVNPETSFKKLTLDDLAGKMLP